MLRRVKVIRVKTHDTHEPKEAAVAHQVVGEEAPVPAMRTLVEQEAEAEAH